MKVVHQEKKVIEHTFEDLCIGDCFLDEQGDLSIKTSDEGYIYSTDDNRNWSTCSVVSQGMIVKPLEATLIIEGEFI